MSLSDSPAVAATASHALLLRLFRHHVRPHLGRLVGAAVCMALVAAMTGLTAWLLEPAINDVFVEGSARMLVLVPLAVVAVALVKGVASYFQNTLMNGVGQRIIAETQVSMYESLIRADLADIQRVHSGKLLSSFLYDANLLRDAVGRAVTGMVKDSLTVVALTTVMFVQDWRLALITAFVLPAAAILLRRFGKRMRKASTRTQEETAKLSAHLSETLEGARLVKAYGMEGRETARARELVERRLVQILKAVRTRSAATPSTEALSGIAVAVAILYGGYQAQAGALTLGAFMSFLGALLMAYQPLKSLASLNTSLQEGLAAAQRVFRVLDMVPTVVDREDALPLPAVPGAIRFRDVHFAYDGEKSALHGVDLEVPVGARVALVGPSGAGKSSALNLIARFYDPDAGAVEIGGLDLRRVRLDSLRAAVALVTQETVLFDDTVRANIAYGRPEASAVEVEAAARAADAHAFIERLPQRYDTVIGENGVTLSGGQRQRLAIARAMLKDAPILLLDEATSALDTESERQVQAALERLMRGRTTVVIAHRLSTVRDADRIFVLDGGRLVEQGDHAALLARGGVYARLYALQFDGEAAPRRAAASG